MSGRSRSLATMLFFEAQLLGMDEVPDRAIIDLKAPLGKLGNQPTYCEVLLPDPLQKPLAMLTGNRFWLVATHLAGGNAAGLAHPPHPIDHRTDAQTKLRRRPVARQPTLLNRRDYTLTKIKRIWSAHRMLASNPASILNQNQPDLGIPIRFRLKSSRFSRRPPRQGFRLRSRRTREVARDAALHRCGAQLQIWLGRRQLQGKVRLLATLGQQPR